MNPLESALFTDFYQLTMLSGYFHQKKAEQRSVYELFFRKVPNHGRILYLGWPRASVGLPAQRSGF
jgi:nicotinic acid phosphoribosyltransferase